MTTSPDAELGLKICLLGGCEFQRAGGGVRLETVKTSALLAFLVLQSDPQPRHKLMGLFWGNQPEANARRNLRHALWNLRQQLDHPDYPPIILSDQQTIAFNHAAPFWLDVREFEQCLKSESEITATAARPDDRFALLREALDLYRGDLLDGVYVDDAPAFEEWLLVERERLRARALKALQRLVGDCVSWGEHDAGFDYARRLLEMEPWLEETHRQLMRLLALSGQRTAALAQYETCRRVLAEELNAEPSPETQALCESIRASAEETQPAHPASTRNLPPQATPFVGRKEELTQLAALLQNPNCRLISLVGQGGIGKTRLAVRAAVDVNGFSDGVFFVPLAGIGSADLLVSAIADAIGLPLQGGADPQTVLLTYVREKEMLLLMDNFEHLLDGTDLLTEIIQASPHVKILVTSRERLNLGTEWLFQVEGLDYPKDEVGNKRDETLPTESYCAVQLFVQVAQRVHLGYTLSEEDRSFAARLCQLVDGMPLAIELAANWVRILSCQEIVAHMEKGMDFLTTTWRDLPLRHRSMRAVFEQSWQLLSDEERQFFKRLSVFRGGFRQDAAGQVADAKLGLLASLVDKSFVKRNPAGRYEIHELLRQYGEEMLNELESVQAHDAHCHYFSEFLHACEKGIGGKRMKETVDEITADIENVRACWNWATQHQRVNEIGQSEVALYRFYELRSWFQEGEAMFDRGAGALSTLTLEPEQQLILAKLYHIRGSFCHRLSRYSQSLKAFEASLAISRRIDSPRFLSASLAELATVQVMHGAYSEAQQLLEEALAGFRKVDDQPNILVVQLNLGYVICQMGDYPKARALLAQALKGFQGLGMRDHTAFAHYSIGLVAHGMRESEKTCANLRNGLSIYRELDYPWGIALCLSGLASVAIRNGKYEQATQLAQEGLAYAKKIGESYITALCLNCMGRIACALGNYGEAKLCYRQAIQTVWEGEQLPPILDGLVGIAELDAIAGQMPAACELLMFVIQHPATSASERDHAARLLAKLEKQVQPEVITAARAKVQMTQLVEIIESCGHSEFTND